MGVAIFFMISGYFLISKRSAHISRVLLEGLFYGFFCGGIALVLKETHVADYISFREIVQGALVSVTNGYIWWFISVYILLMLMVPCMNAYIRNSSKQLIIITLIAIWIFPYSLDILFDGIFTSLIKGIFYYLLGGFIRQNIDENKIQFNKMLCIISFIISWLLYTVDFYLINGSTFHSSKLTQIGNSIGESVFALVCSASLFMVLKNFKFYCKTINIIASTTFGMYLISDFPPLRMFIWENIWHLQDIYLNRRFFAMKGMVIIVTTCSVCGFIDYIRQKAIEPYTIKIWYGIINKLNCGKDNADS